MSKKITKIEQSIWSVKINDQPLYKKLVDGVTVLSRLTPEENKKIAEILDKAIADCSQALAGRGHKREIMASGNSDGEDIKNTPRHSTWSVKVNTQLLYKKTLNGRTILYGMNEDEHNMIAQIMDEVFDQLADVLKDKTEMREVVVQEREQVTIADGAKYAAAMKKEEEIFKTKTKTLNKKKSGKKKEENVAKKITKNKLKEKIEKKKKSGSKSSFWDNLK